MKQKSTQVVLPTYCLDSNLVLLPGIIYNVTFNRFKAAALLYRFKKQVQSVTIVNNLLGEYNFNEAGTSEAPALSTISEDAIDGITKLNEQTLSTQGKRNSEFDWMTFVVIPNLDKIKEPIETPKPPVVTVVRVVGIVDDTTNIKLTLQAVARGVRVDATRKLKTNEALIDVVFDGTVENIKPIIKSLKNKAYHLFDCIDDFVVEYRKALNNSDADGNNLLALNPLANAFYLQLAGSKDFSKAYSSLQQLYGSFSADDKPHSKSRSEAFLRLLDITGAVLPFPNHEKLKYLGMMDPTERAAKLKSMIGDLISVFANLKQNNAFVNHWFYNEATNIQRANMVANQLKSMRIVLDGMTKKPARKALVRKEAANEAAQDNNDNEDDDDDDDELRAITNFIKNKLPHIVSLSPDSKRLIVKDYKRIKSSSQSGSGGGSGADFHVIRNYLEIVMDIPWDNFVTKFKSNKDIDLAAAKAQLEADHYGLEHVKRRLIQYLVVLKLLGINTENALKTQQSIEQAGKSTSVNKTYDDSTIVIANNDETSSSRKNAQRKVENSYNESSRSLALGVSKNNRSPIIMLAGPPGTGKTSLAKSIASALGRNFQRISLGGVKDESEIRGHRRTYVGAMPGLIIQALRKARSMNPVILLDEIDKVVGGGSAARVNGDPSAALLEVLDPEQNSTFIDHYLGFPVDLSQVIFICTANEPQEMSRPLLDRVEMINVNAYDYNEKLIIGRKYLLPRQIKRNGFPTDGGVIISEPVMKKIVIDYTREAGVRGFERKLGTICRYKAAEYCESLEDSNVTYNPTVTEVDLSKFLGVPYSMGDFAASEVTVSNGTRVGIVNGMSYNSDGSGSVLVFESIGFDKRVGNPENVNSGCTLSMTGRLGEVLSESAKIALTFIKSLVYKGLLSLKNKDASALVDKFSNMEINLHVPSGSISKDGPSAGITMALSFLSLILDKPVPHDIAMTGEITLRGLVLPIGGIKEKMMGAHLNGGIKRIIVPRENRKDLIEDYSRSIEEAGTVDTQTLNELLRDNEDMAFKMSQVEDFYLTKYGIQIYYAREFNDVMKVVWGEDVLMKTERTPLVEYHL